MTDKAAREAFEKWFRLTWKPEPGNFDAMADFWFDRLDDGRYEITRLEDAWRGWLAGYQAAHDAAMAAEPDVQNMIAAYRTFHLDDKGCDYDKTTADTLESLLLQRQAAQQREAECRKDADCWRRLEQALAGAHATIEQLADSRQIDIDVLYTPISKGETT